MNFIGTMAQKAISAVSALAEVEKSGVRMSATEIAKRRGISQPLIGKLMSTLSMAGLVEGTRGPGGGFRLARPAKEIALYDVIVLFDRLERPVRCPMGEGYCGTGPECPMHRDLVEMAERFLKKLKGVDFEGFAKQGRMEVVLPKNG